MRAEITTSDGQHTSGQRQPQHVFAVNHDPDFLLLLHDLLDSEGYTITTTHFTPQTWDQIATAQPALAIVDIVPYRTHGWHLLERLHAEASTAHIPVVVTSTDRDVRERVMGEPERYGANRVVVVKPLNLSDVLDAIHDLIGPAQ